MYQYGYFLNLALSAFSSFIWTLCESRTGNTFDTRSCLLVSKELRRNFGHPFWSLFWSGHIILLFANLASTLRLHIYRRL